ARGFIEASPNLFARLSAKGDHAGIRLSSDLKDHPVPVHQRRGADGCCILNLVILRQIPFPDQFSGSGLKAIKAMSLRTGGINFPVPDDRCSVWARFLAGNKSPRRIIRFPRESPKQFSRCLLKAKNAAADLRSEEHTSELQSRFDLVCR